MQPKEAGQQGKDDGSPLAAGYTRMRDGRSLSLLAVEETHELPRLQLPTATRLLAVATCAYLAASFLTVDASRGNEPRLVERYRRSGLAAAVVASVLALGGIVVLRADAPELYRGLTSRGLPLVLVSAASGLASVGFLARRRPRPARIAAVVAVVAVVWGWAAGQYPDLLVDRLTIAEAAGSPSTLVAMVASLSVGAALFAPALVVLLAMSARGRLDPEAPGSGSRPVGDR